MNEKDKYIKLISDMSDRYENKLLDCMDNVINLHDISVQDLKEFYEGITRDCPIVTEIGDKNKINAWCEQAKYIPKAEQEQHCLTCLLYAKRQENDKKYEINNNNNNNERGN